MADGSPTPLIGKTKLRILDHAVAAFNRDGFGQVTVSALADEIGMSEGNLWYHYRTKADLLDGIQTLFIRDWQELFEVPLESGDLAADYAGFVSAWQELFTRYVFLFRDRSEYGAHSDALSALLPEIYAQVSARLRTHYGAMAARGALSGDAGDLDDLIRTVIIVTRFYLEFEAETRAGAASSCPEDALAHHLTVLRPMMEPDLLSAIQERLAMAADVDPEG